MALAPGIQLGSYTIVGPLGAGGMGEVYRARDNRLGREVALKMLPEGFATDPARRARFEREARTVASLSHPNIVTLFTVEDEGDIHFLTMELVEGQSIDHAIAPGGLPISRVIEIGIAMADALAAAHERNIVHRDLKPANVMLTKDGRIKVLDFGLAKPTSAESLAEVATIAASPTSDGLVVGTVPYMAPEQIRGEAVDARTDLFALGVVLYELASGARPFSGASTADVTSAILRDAPEPLARRRPEIPPSLERVVSRCLEKSPRERMQSALDVSNELRRVRKEMEAPVLASRPAQEKMASVAVLPFVNRSASPEDEYFSDGLADEMLNVLSKIKGLRVIARASAFHFKGKNVPIAEIGKALGVVTVLDGSVRKSGNRVRISVQLVNVADSSHLWSETYDRTLDDIFAVQDDIAQSVVKELRTTLLGEAADSDASGAARAEVAKAAQGRGSDPEAQRLFLQGRYLVDRFNAEDVRRGIELFGAAIALDPAHAMAWAELSLAYAWQAGWAWGPQEEGYAKAREAALRAIELEPGLETGHAALGYVFLIADWNWTGAEASYRRALELAPRNTRALLGAGWLMRAMGRIDEALVLLERAVETDPLSATAYNDLGTTYYFARRFADAETALRKALELAPQRAETRSQLAMVLLAQGRKDDALGQASLETYDGFSWWALAIILYAMGRPDESNRELAKLVDGFAREGGYQIAQVHAGRGELDDAFVWLQRAHDQNDAGFVYLMGDPLMDDARRDPRWKDLLEKLGIAG